MACMCTDCPIFERNLFFPNYSLVVEFVTIIVTLHNYQINNQSSKQRFICSSLPTTSRSSFLLFGLLLTSTMATLLKDFILYFSNRDVNGKGGQKDPVEYIENLNFEVDS